MRWGSDAVSGTGSPYLMRRAGRFYVRVRVPAELMERVGLVEVRRALRPMHFHEARLIAARTGAQIKECFRMMRSADHMTNEEAANLIRDCFKDQESWSDRGYAPRTQEIDLELQEQEALAREHLTGLQVQVEQRSFDQELVRTARNYSAAHGIDLATASEDRLNYVVEGIARALIEADRQYLFRLHERLSSYTADDPLFAGPARDLGSGVGLTVNELIEEYCRFKKAEWTPKTLRTHRPKLKLLAEFVGGDRRAEEICRADLLPYPEALLRLRKNYASGAAKSFSSHQTGSESGRIKASTAQTILARTTALFRWSFERGYISTNPAVGLSIAAPKSKKGLKPRRPFTADELTKLFSAPLFTGCHSRFRRFDLGEAVIRDEYFYLPILAYYTGARLGELVQLHFADCMIEGPTPFISINEDGPEKPGQDGFKHVKSHAGVRVVPLHPDLEALGFADFVRGQRKAAGKRKRVFFGIKYGADGQPSTVYSKWFARFLDKVGLEDRALVFHSFRHTAEDFFRTSQVPKYVIDQLIGHQDASSGGAYGSGITLDAASEVVGSLKLPLRLPQLLNSPSK